MAKEGTVSHYSLSFTSGSLLMRESMVAAPIYMRTHDWGSVRHQLQDGNLLQARTSTSSQRRSRETVQRLEVLNDKELELLVEATSPERAHLLWVAACRRYALIGDFAQDVLREKYLLLAPTVGYDDFDAFVREKALWHDEVAGLRPSTLAKLRATLFRMMIEAAFLDEQHRLLEALLSARVSDLLQDRSPSDLRYFPVRGVPA